MKSLASFSEFKIKDIHDAIQKNVSKYSVSRVFVTVANVSSQIILQQILHYEEIRLRIIPSVRYPKMNSKYFVWITFLDEAKERPNMKKFCHHYRISLKHTCHYFRISYRTC